MGASVVGEVVGVAVVVGAPVIIGTSAAVGALIEKRNKKGGGHGGALNTATPQRKLTNTASPHEK